MGQVSASTKRAVRFGAVVGAMATACVAHPAPGSPDTTFTPSVHALTGIRPVAVALDSGGSIFLVGQGPACATSDPTATAFTLLHVLVDGTDDPLIGPSGLCLDFGGTVDLASALLVDSRGRILVAGSSDGVAVLARFQSTGDRDLTFATSGVLPLEGDPGARWSATSIAFESSSIVAALTRQDALGARVLRVAPDGPIDPQFTPTDVAVGAPAAIAITVSSAGIFGVATAASATEGGSTISTLRFLDAGGLDPSFGSNGVATFPLSNAVGTSLAVDGGGNTIAGGFVTSAAGLASVAFGVTDASGTFVGTCSIDDLAPASGLAPPTPAPVVAAAPNGELFVFGSAGGVAQVRRVRQDCSVDVAWSQGGVWSSPDGQGSSALSVVLDGEGRAVIFSESSGGGLRLDRVEP